MRKICLTFLSQLFLALTGWSQTQTILDVDIANTVAYVYDNSDYTKFATDPNQVPTGAVRTFGTFLNFGDITAVNADAMKGTWIARVQVFRMATTPTAGSSIGDSNRFGIAEFQLEIIQPDGTPVGSIFMQGQNFGAPIPGAPMASNGGSFAIVGGTGAFLGARGQASTAPARAGGGARNASINEDPSARRQRTGGGQRLLVQLITNSLSTPEVAVTPDGPAVVHSSDNTLVTAAKPVRAGETLTLYATGLGPTRPGVDPGTAFPADTAHIVNAPVKVIVNGTPTPALYAGGYANSVNGYQVNFQLPDNIAAGSVTLALNVAWITGPEVKVPVQ
jgi:hypothetical protein